MSQFSTEMNSQLIHDFREFLEMLSSHGQMISLSPQIVSFCRHKLGICGRTEIRKLVQLIEKCVQSGVPIDETLVDAMFGNCPQLSDFYSRLKREGDSKVLCQEIARIQKSSQELMPTLRRSNCKPMSGKGKFLLSLQVSSSSSSSVCETTQSFVLNEEQIACLLDDMNMIRQQLLRSVQSA